MSIVISNLSKFMEDLSPHLHEVVGGDFSPYPMLGSQFLNQKSMDSMWTDIGTRSTLGAFVIKPEIGEQAEDSYIVGPQMRVKAVEYAKRVPTSRIVLEDAKTFEEAAKLLAGIGKDIRQRADDTKEILAHDLLNSTEYNTPDGVSLFSNIHVNLQGDTFSNLNASSALTEATLEAAVTDLKSMIDDRGFPINQMAARLIVPIGPLEWTAMRILGTDKHLGGNDNDINLMSRQNLSLTVSPYLTSADTWFLQAARHDLNWYDREASRVWSDGDDNRGIVEQGMTFRSAIAAGDPRSIIKNTA